MKHHSDPVVLWASSFALLIGLSSVNSCADDEIAPDDAFGITTTPTTSTSTSNGTTSFLECVNSRPHGDPSEGLEICDNGMIHRVRMSRCGDTSTVRDPLGECSLHEQPDSTCRFHSDCQEGPDGICLETSTSPQLQPDRCSCSYQRLPDCTSDEDCPSGEGCICGRDGGYCTPLGSRCNTDVDCPGDLLCKRSEDRLYAYGCYEDGITFSFHCQTPEDECASTDDCSPDGPGPGCFFNSSSQRFTCDYLGGNGGYCPGRPFIIDDEFRLAEVKERRDWSSECSPTLHTPEGAREAAAKHWTEAGLMEHASIAAFARFAMQLMSLGAPPDLIEATTQAMRDETHHAKDCFALASHFAGKPVGPGPLAIENALDDSNDLLNIVALTIHEGCIGETVAALEAVDALQYTEDPVIRSVLERIAQDERQHAALAWNFIRWVLRTHPHTRSEIQTLFFQTIEHECQSVRLDIYETEQDLRHLGVFSASQSRSIKRRVLGSIIEPLACALFEGVVLEAGRV